MLSPALCEVIACAASSPFSAQPTMSPMSSAQTFAASRALPGSPSGYGAASIEKTKSAMFPPTNRPPRRGVTPAMGALVPGSPRRSPEELARREVGEHGADPVRGLLPYEVQSVIHHRDDPLGENFG